MGKEGEVTAAIARKLGLQQQLELGCRCNAPCLLKTSLCNILAASRAAQRLHSLFIEVKLLFVGIGSRQLWLACFTGSCFSPRSGLAVGLCLTC